MCFFGRGSHDELIDFGAFAPTHHGVPTVLSPSKEGEERGKETAWSWISPVQHSFGSVSEHFQTGLSPWVAFVLLFLFI